GEGTRGVGGGQELAPQCDILPRDQAEPGAYLTWPGHRLDGVIGNHGRPVCDQLAVDRDLQVPDARRADQVRTCYLGAEDSVQRDRAAFTPPDSRRDAVPA